MSLSRRKKTRKAAPAVPAPTAMPAAPPAPLPKPWRLGLLILAGLLLWGSYSTEIADTDFWWHLKTGQYIAETRALPVPDPFSYTTDLGEPSYAGEEQVRQFNLTHEWLAQVLMFLVYQIGGFPLLVLWKGLLLATFCSVAGYLAAWRSGNFFVGLAAAFVGMPLVKLFAADRPPLLTFVLVAGFVLILDKYRAGEWDRTIWLLIPLQWAWSNLHGGFFLGWVVMGAYVVGSWKLPPERRKNLWIAVGTGMAASAVNPNFLRVFEVLMNYRQSYLTATLIEWKSPPLWGPPYTFNVLLYLAAAVLLINFKKVRIPDALLFLAFAAAGLMAFRNVIFMAFFAPVYLAAYGWPMLSKRLAPTPKSVIAAAAGMTMASVLVLGLVQGTLFQLRAAEWRFPQRAADFLRSNQVEARMLNSYEYGGYLIWALWPEQQTFIDGRALNETVYRDYQAILYPTSANQQENSRLRGKLLDQYGVEIVVMNGFEYVTGVIYPLVLAMANPQNNDWQLVFADEGAVVFARDSERNRDLIANHRLEKGRVLDHLENSCRIYIEHDPELPNCARTLGFLFLQGGNRQRARANFSLYLENIPYSDPEAENAFRRASGSGG